MYCNYCGKVIQDDANICAYCGVRVGGVIARKRLVRPRVGRAIAGVGAGLAQYLDIHFNLGRRGWFLVGINTGRGLLSYPIAWIVIPEEPLMLSAPAGYPVTGQ